MCPQTLTHGQPAALDGLIEQVRDHARRWAEQLAGAETRGELEGFLSHLFHEVRLFKELIDQTDDATGPTDDLAPPPSSPSLLSFSFRVVSAVCFRACRVGAPARSGQDANQVSTRFPEAAVGVKWKCRWAPPATPGPPGSCASTSCRG